MELSISNLVSCEKIVDVPYQDVDSKIKFANTEKFGYNDQQ